jgi:flagella synthesis protein FlgN
MIEKTFPLAEKLLSNGRKSAEYLFDLLTREYEQLKLQADPSLLATIAADKQAAATQLEQFSKQFSQILATEQLTVSQEGVKSYFEKAKTARFNVTETWQSWTDITALSKVCRSLNEQNGACIELLNRHTARALQILRGRSNFATTYGPDGSTRSELFSHTLISV